MVTLQENGQSILKVLENVKIEGPPPRKGPAPTTNDLNSRNKIVLSPSPFKDVPYVFKGDADVEQSGPG